jgi:hypothetical protein
VNDASSTPPAEQETLASRPRLRSRLRMVPLSVLCSLTVVLAVVGALNDGVITSELPVAAAPPAAPATDPAAARQSAQAQKACRPAWRTGVTSEPWAGSRRARSEAKFKARIAKENPGYIKGRDGWLTFPDVYANNFSQALGRVTQTRAEERAWAAYFTRAQRLTEKQGGEFRIVVAPATWEVHPDKLPTWAQKLRGTNTLTNLMAHYPELPWVDVRPALRAASQKKAVYEPLNSHWTPYGGFVAWKAISKCLNTTKGLQKVGVPGLRKVVVEPNLNEFASYVPDGKPVRTVPVYQAPLPETTITSYPEGEPVEKDPYGGVDALFLPAVSSTPDALSDQTLLVYRDSTGSALSPLWFYSYARTVQYQHGILTLNVRPPKLKRTINTHKPDVFIYLISERLLDGAAPRR